MKSMNRALGLTLALSALLAACNTNPPTPAKTQAPTASSALIAPAYTVSKWEMLPEWQAMDISPSWPAFLQSCSALKAKPHWQEVCDHAAAVDKNDSAAQRAFYQEWFVPYQVFNPDGSDQGIITGYYEPLLKGSRVKTERFHYPLYGVPNDLLEIDLG